jgi:large subunit ribosomal protein L19
MAKEIKDVRNELKAGMIVKVHQKIKELNKKGEEKERIQIFEGIIIAIKHGNEPGATITVRKDSKGFGVEKIYPIHSPVVAMIELVRQMKVRQARPYYIRTHKKKLKEIKPEKKEIKKEVKKKEIKKIEKKVEKKVEKKEVKK